MAKCNGQTENSEASTELETLVDSEQSAALQTALDALRDIAQQQLTLLIPVQDIAGGLVDARSKYDPRIHAELCRKKLMGLSNQSAARAVGIDPATLSGWLKRYPKLAYDLEQAAALANAQAAALLQVMMHGNDPTAFHALKLFLETHAPEFQKTTKVAIEHDLKGIVGHIRGIYQLPPAASGAGGAQDDEIDAESTAEEEDEASEEAESGLPPFLDALPPPAGGDDAPKADFEPISRETTVEVPSWL